MERLQIAIPVALLLLVLAAVGSRLLAAGAASRIEVPIYQVRLPDGTIRYWVPVTIGRRGPIEAMLDTGSVGLRVFEGALSPGDYQDTGVEGSVRYGSGVELHGTVARAPLKIGDATTGEAVPIHIVRSVGCSAAKPNCPAVRLRPEEYGIGGDGLPRQGFKAILGLSLRNLEGPGSPVNPLGVFGNQAWIVILPLPDSEAPGKLIINPTAAEREGFRMAPFVVSTPPNRFAICMAEAGTEPCPLVMLDSGAAPGLPPFYSHAVLYDRKSNAVGVKPRADARR